MRQLQEKTRTQIAAVTGLVVGSAGLFLGMLSLSLNTFEIPEDSPGTAWQVETRANKVFSIPNAPIPLYLRPTTDPVFGTKIVRITPDGGTSYSLSSAPTVSGTWGVENRHTYSKNQPWNSDQTMLAIENRGTGASGSSFLILDGANYKPKYAACSGRWDDRWLPTLARRFERVNVNKTGTTLEWYDVRNCIKTKTIALPIGANGIGNSEGNVSADGRFVGLYGTVGAHQEAFVVDMAPTAGSGLPTNGVVGARVNISDCGLTDCTIDWVSVTPDALYLVVSYEGDHVRVYDINRDQASPNYLALSVRNMSGFNPKVCGTHNPAQGFIYDVGHADMALNPYQQNEAVLVGQRRSECSGVTDNRGVAVGSVVMVRIRDGHVTSLTSPANEASSHHISLRNYNFPGWAYVGYYDQQGKRFSDEVIAVKLDGSYDVKRYAHKRSAFSSPPLASSCYRCESHSVPSPDGKRILFASNWNTHVSGPVPLVEAVKNYIIDTR